MTVQLNPNMVIQDGYGKMLTEIEADMVYRVDRWMWRVDTGVTYQYYEIQIGKPK